MWTFSLFLALSVLYHFVLLAAPQDEVHVAIFVHGFQGAATDLCLVKAHLMLMFPYLECYCSKTNEVGKHTVCAGKRGGPVPCAVVTGDGRQVTMRVRRSRQKAPSKRRAKRQNE